MRRWFRDFIQGIKNLRYYYRVIWDDRDWDQHYLLDLMHTKISKMYKYYLDSVILEDTDKVKIVSKLAVVKDALQLAMDENYCEKEYDEHYIKYPRALYNTNDMSEEERSGFLLIAELEKHREQKNLHDLFDTMRDNILTWWD